MYTNGTTNYNLPQYVDSDKATWTDLNAPFNAIDAAIKGAVDDTAQEALDIDALKARMDTAEQNIGTNTTNIAGLDTRLTTAEGAITSQASQIADVKQDTEDMICAYNEASATSTHRYEVGDYFIYNDVLYKATQAIAIGDTIVPDTNCATTNVVTEIKPVLIAQSNADGVKTLGDMCKEILTNDIVNEIITNRNLYKYTLLRGNPAQYVGTFNLANVSSTIDGHTATFNLTETNVNGNNVTAGSVGLGVKNGEGFAALLTTYYNTSTSTSSVTASDNSNVIPAVGNFIRLIRSII